MDDNYGSHNLDQKEDILLLINQKADLSEKIAQMIIEEPLILDTILNGLSSKTARVKFRCAKILKIISSKNPELLIGNWDFFVNLLGTSNKIILWNTLDILANLTSIDSEHKFDYVYERYYQFLEDESMVTAAHVVDNSGQIILNRPDLKYEITQKLLSMDKTPRDGQCNDILTGKALGAFETYYARIEDKKPILKYAHEAQHLKEMPLKCRQLNF